MSNVATETETPVQCSCPFFDLQSITKKKSWLNIQEVFNSQLSVRIITLEYKKRRIKLCEISPKKSLKWPDTSLGSVPTMHPSDNQHQT
jgi:hypothetical protein